MLPVITNHSALSNPTKNMLIRPQKKITFTNAAINFKTAVFRILLGLSWNKIPINLEVGASRFVGISFQLLFSLFDNATIINSDKTFIVRLNTHFVINFIVYKIWVHYFVDICWRWLKLICINYVKSLETNYPVRQH